MLIKARFLVPVTAPVIENGAICIADGRIQAIGDAHDFNGEDATDFGDAVVLPGLVNAHTHLELTHLKDQVPPTADFTGWLSGLMAQRMRHPTTEESHCQSVRNGMEQSIAAGTTTVGDITAMPQWTRKTMAHSAMKCVSFGEVIAIGLRRERLEPRLDSASNLAFQSSTLRIGISPHAPYTIEPDGLRACAQRAQTNASPICVHLAETTEEELFTRSAEGPFAQYLKELGIWDDQIPASGCSPVELAKRVTLLHPATLLAHANYVSDRDMQTIAESGASVAYCPRTHHAFGHAPHRFQEMASIGINVCLGTDSLASNPSLSLLEEMRFLRRHHRDLPAESIVRMATVNGAKALGLADGIGSLTIGKHADLLVLPLEQPFESNTWCDVLERAPGPLAVLINGRQPETRRDDDLRDTP